MPEARLTKTRDSLPEGYQFGDARPTYGEGMTLRQYMKAEMDDRRRAAARFYAGCCNPVGYHWKCACGFDVRSASALAVVHAFKKHCESCELGVA